MSIKTKIDFLTSNIKEAALFVNELHIHIKELCPTTQLLGVEHIDTNNSTKVEIEYEIGLVEVVKLSEFVCNMYSDFTVNEWTQNYMGCIYWGHLNFEAERLSFTEGAEANDMIHYLFAMDGVNRAKQNMYKKKFSQIDGMMLSMMSDINELDLLTSYTTAGISSTGHAESNIKVIKEYMDMHNGSDYAERLLMNEQPTLN